ncbi:MAG: carbohydrate kinase, partial [Lachnospiraceae bacterium]|nr:carbohydrate kinase [Lachnospiraceae bacterium]
GGLVKDGSAVAVIGTYGSTYVALDKSMRDPNKVLIFKGNSGPENFTFEAASIASASSYRWYRDVFCDLEVAAGKVVGEDPYELINQQIETVAPGANGITFLPYLQGAGSGPRADIYARGCILNASLGTTKAEIARAIMEGITYEMRDNIEAIKRVGIELNDLRIVGGGTKAPLWCQMQADIYKQSVSVLQTSETGCLGAAIYAGVGVGIYKDYEDASEKAVRVKEIYHPNPENYAAYDEGYKRYCVAYESLANGGYFLLNK